MQDSKKSNVSRRGFVALAVSIVMAVSLFAMPMSAVAATPNTDFYYVEILGTWVPAPMGQDTVSTVTNNGDGTYTVSLSYGFYDSPDLGYLVGKVTVFDGVDQDGLPFEINPVTASGGFVTFNFDPSVSNFVIIEKLTIEFTYAGRPDWDHPIFHLPLTGVAFCPLGGPPVI